MSLFVHFVSHQPLKRVTLQSQQALRRHATLMRRAVNSCAEILSSRKILIRSLLFKAALPYQNAVRLYQNANQPSTTQQRHNENTHGLRPACNKDRLHDPRCISKYPFPTRRFTIIVHYFHKCDAVFSHL